MELGSVFRMIYIVRDSVEAKMAAKYVCCLYIHFKVRNTLLRLISASTLYMFRAFSRRLNTRGLLLISDPLKPDRFAKSQADSLFPKPRFVSFDLWGTLYTPKKPIAELYYEISKNEFGIDKSLESLKAEFPEVHKELLIDFPNYGKYSDHITNCKDWWLELIVKLYGLPHYLENEKSAKLCDRLVEYFSSLEAYILFDDVKPTLEKLRKNNVRIIASSNSDDRVFPIMKSLGIDRYFENPFVYISYDLGTEKPERAFFRSIAGELYKIDKANEPRLSMQEFLENLWHVGDSYEKDFVGAVKAGWNGVLIDRPKTSVFFRNGPQKASVSNDCFEAQSADSLDSDDMVMIANNRVAVSSLTEVLRLFELE